MEPEWRAGGSAVWRRTAAVTERGNQVATYWRDADTGLDYADQRYYSPGTGRFLTSDPAVLGDPTDAGSWNLYAYVHGDPVNYVDPTGEFRIPVISGIGTWLGQILGFIGSSPVLPGPRVSYSFIERQKVHKETTDKWVAALAAAVAVATAAQQESEDPLRYPKYLVPVSDTCHGSNPVERRVTYELYDDRGDFMSAARITENLLRSKGNSRIPGILLLDPGVDVMRTGSRS